MSHPVDPVDGLDARVKEAFAPPSGPVARLVAHALERARRDDALEPRRPPRPAIRWRPALAAGAGVLAVVAGGVIWLRPTPPPARARATVTADGDFVVVKVEGAGIWLTASDARGDATPGETARVVTFGAMK